MKKEFIEINLETKGGDFPSEKREISKKDINKLINFASNTFSRILIVMSNYEYKNIKRELLQRSKEILELKKKIELLDKEDLIGKIREMKKKLQSRLYYWASDVAPKVNDKGEKICLMCHTKLKGKQDKYCSERCSSKFYKTKMWDWIVGDIFERDDYTCQNCGYKISIFIDCFGETKKIVEELECDHIIPVALGGAPLDKKNMQTLCKKCHREKTKEDIGKIKKYYNGLK